MIWKYFMNRFILRMKVRHLIVLFLAIHIGAVIQAQNQLSIEHSDWTKMLNQFVELNGGVDYEGFNANEQELDQYLEKLRSNVPQKSWSRNQSMAYWINAYNAFTIKLILNHYPLNSIMEINGGKAWDLQFIQIGDVSYSLNDIEHQILRKEYKDPRIHFAVNCASVSCPKLLNQAFEANSLENQLEKATRLFINNAQKNKITANKIVISKLFEWYADDFKGGQSVIEYLNQYSKITIKPNAEVAFMEYDWNLNSK